MENVNNKKDNKEESMASYLGKIYGKMSRRKILKDLRDEDDRF